MDGENHLLRRRRAVEAGTFAARLSGLVSTALLVVGWLPLPEGMAADLTVVCLIGVAIMALANVMAVLNYRRPDGPHYDRFSAVQVGCDMLVMIGTVAVFQISSDITTWPGLAIAIVSAAVRLRLRGALISWAVSSLAFAVILTALGDRAVRPEDLPYAIVVHLVVALHAGTQSSAFARQVQQLDAAREALHHQATHDLLTGLPNRASLAEHARPTADASLAVLLLDLNGFKQVNDSYGHAAGDRLLREVAQRLTAVLPETDVAYRLGGDEFVVLSLDAGLDEVTDLAHRIRAAVAAPIDLDGSVVTVGASIGMAGRAAGEPVSLDDLLAEADAAMYRNKHSSQAA
ncbi:GGDEF domain-containing protein [Actinoplanes aureus]|uniref:GGDEF domain-containing protein n=1 Tax=Actinoplanes aureus TaxID=2792083 RepID=A0A931CF36_9ACTN|nr:GGDEF domain-containing protein [Actinoplanes aureus]MBG0565361.1 GGDEF domain-containing protein [Actinoplanes aureus]